MLPPFPLRFLHEQEDDAIPTGRLTWWQALGVTTTELEEVGRIIMRELFRLQASMPPFNPSRAVRAPSDDSASAAASTATSAVIAVQEVPALLTTGTRL